MYKKINIKTISKNIHYIIFVLLIVLLFIILYAKYFNKNKNKEYFTGNKNNSIIIKEMNDLDDGTQAEKKDYKVFPPVSKSKYDLLNNIFGNIQNDDNDNNNADNANNNNTTTNTIKDFPISMPKSQDIGKPELEKNNLQKTFSKLDDKTPLLGSCDFYFNKCPSNKSSMATIKGNNLTCGKNGTETKKAEAIAQIKNGHISKIIIINNGVGYNYQNPPKVIIESTSGNGASAKANVDKNGTISSIDIIDYGYGYVETPNINIEPPQMDGVCHLCC
jgi:hypothetical protein